MESMAALCLQLRFISLRIWEQRVSMLLENKRIYFRPKIFALC
ncbi:hypothetical protein MCETALH18_01577 [Methylophilaceae bacterium]